MGFDWSTYLDLSKDLAKNSDEASLRTAISRAYYAGLITARNHLIGRGVNIPGTESQHVAIWDCFKGKGRTQASIYQNGMRLRNKRRVADYEDDCPNLPGQTALAIKDAELVLHWISQL